MCTDPRRFDQVFEKITFHATFFPVNVVVRIVVSTNIRDFCQSVLNFDFYSENSMIVIIRYSATLPYLHSTVLFTQLSPVIFEVHMKSFLKSD